MRSALLIGLGKFGRHIAMYLDQIGIQVMAVDNNEERVNEVLPYVTKAQIGDITNLEFLESLGVSSYDVCYVALGSNFQTSLETTLNLKEHGAKFVVSRAASEIHEKFLKRSGADEVFFPERQVAKWVSITYSAEYIFDYFELDDKHAIFEVPVPKNWAGKSIIEIDVRKNHGINIIAIKQDGKLSVTLTPNTILEENMNLMVIGEYKTLHKLFKV